MTRYASAISLVVSLMLAATTAAAEERKMSGAEILKTLSEARVVGEDFEQTFSAPEGETPAATTYWQGGAASRGTWRVTGDQYCSQWPPATSWDCYDMTRFEKDGDAYVVWTGYGNRYVGKLAD